MFYFVWLSGFGRADYISYRHQDPVQHYWNVTFDIIPENEVDKTAMGAGYE